MSQCKRLLFLLACLMLAASPALAQRRAQAPRKTAVKKAPVARKAAPPRPIPAYADLAYATVGGGQPLKLDLYLPATGEKPYPLVIHIHGGGWRGGSKNGLPGYAARLLKLGFAVASVQYRLTSQAGQWGDAPVIFPAQIQDVKGAVRWLRANAEKYSLDPKRFGACGESAGGHLTALLTVSGGVAELEGDVGGNTGVSSVVQAGVDYYGPTDFLKLNDDITTPPGCVLNHDAPDSFVGYLLGYDKPGQGQAGLKKHLTDPSAPYPQLKHLVELLSPVTFVKPGLPPLFIGHGTKDLLVPLAQSQRLAEMLKQAGDRVELSVSEGAPHGDLGPKTDKAAVLFFCDVLNPAAKARAEAMSFSSARPLAAAAKKKNRS